MTTQVRVFYGFRWHLFLSRLLQLDVFASGGRDGSVRVWDVRVSPSSSKSGCKNCIVPWKMNRSKSNTLNTKRTRIWYCHQNILLRAYASNLGRCLMSYLWWYKSLVCSGPHYKSAQTLLNAHSQSKGKPVRIIAGKFSVQYQFQNNAVGSWSDRDLTCVLAGHLVSGHCRHWWVRNNLHVLHVFTNSIR